MTVTAQTTGMILVRVAVAGMIFGAACSSQPDSTEGAAGAESLPTAATADGDGLGDPIASRAPGADEAAPSEPAAPGADDDALAGGEDENGAAAAGKPGSKLPPPHLPMETPVPVRAAVSPQCVSPGDSVTLEVDTKPKAAIGYQAVYSDGKGGGGAPFGAGYGGNDKGFASEGGDYSSTWVVSPDAPAGGGRVDVVIGFRGEFGYDGPHFAVADSDGNCPEKWLRGDG